MSKNRENVTWQGSNGKWNRGFFEFVVTGPDDEWDVEYNPGKFFWAATGLPSEDAAHESWQGANPGGGRRLPWSKKDRAEIERYEKMAAEFNQGAMRGGSERTRKSPAQLEREIRASLATRKPYRR